MAGHGWKGLEMAGIAENGLNAWKWLELAEMAWNGWKWPEIAGNNQNKPRSPKINQGCLFYIFACLFHIFLILIQIDFQAMACLTQNLFLLGSSHFHDSGLWFSQPYLPGCQTDIFEGGTGTGSSLCRFGTWTAGFHVPQRFPLHPKHRHHFW